MTVLDGRERSARRCRRSVRRGWHVRVFAEHTGRETFVRASPVDDKSDRETMKLPASVHESAAVNRVPGGDGTHRARGCVRWRG